MRLVLDTSSKTLRMGLLSEDDNRWVRIEEIHEEKPQQSKLILKMIQDLLKQESLDRTAIRSVAVNLGPGSYTGLRVGLTVAKIWSFSMEVPLYSFRLPAIDPLDSLKEEDFILQEEISMLSPIYENDKFGE